MNMTIPFRTRTTAYQSRLGMTDKSKKTFDGDSSKRLEKEVQKEADALWESGVLGADVIEQIGKEHWRTPYLA